MLQNDLYDLMVIDVGLPGDMSSNDAEPSKAAFHIYINYRTGGIFFEHVLLFYILAGRYKQC